MFGLLAVTVSASVRTTVYTKIRSLRDPTPGFFRGKDFRVQRPCAGQVVRPRQACGQDGRRCHGGDTLPADPDAPHGVDAVMLIWMRIVELHGYCLGAQWLAIASNRLDGGPVAGRLLGPNGSLCPPPVAPMLGQEPLIS